MTELSVELADAFQRDENFEPNLEGTGWVPRANLTPAARSFVLRGTDATLDVWMQLPDGHVEEYALWIGDGAEFIDAVATDGSEERIISAEDYDIRQPRVLSAVLERALATPTAQTKPVSEDGVDVQEATPLKIDRIVPAHLQFAKYFE